MCLPGWPLLFHHLYYVLSMKKNYRLALTLDLKGDLRSREEYIKLHKAVWPEIKASILQAGIIDMNIYNFGNRLFMVMQVDESFSFERKVALDAVNSKVQEWEELMWKYQKPIAGAKSGEKWVLMDEIFSLKDDTQ